MRLDAELQNTKLFRRSWLVHVHEQLCQGKKAATQSRSCSKRFIRASQSYGSAMA